MRGVSIVAFAASAALAAAFFVWKGTGIDLPYLTPVNWLGEWVLPIAYILGAIGLLTAIISKKIDEGTFAIIGGIAGAAAIVFSVLQFAHEQKRSVDRATLQLFLDIEAHQPPNARFCRCALYKLLMAEDRNPLDQLLSRAEVPLTREVRGWIDKCFSDVKTSERSELMAGDKLTQQGASFFATRVGRILNLDDDVAFAVHYGIARKENVSEATKLSSAVAKIVANAYEEKFGFKGFANLQRLQVGKLPEKICEESRGFATSLGTRQSHP